MHVINVLPDCGNSPKKVFLKDFYSSLAKGEAHLFRQYTSTEFSWKIVGKMQEITHPDALSYVSGLAIWKVKVLTLHTIITHGSDASVSGQVVSEDNTEYSFCDLIKFKSASGTHIKNITSFLIKVS